MYFPTLYFKSRSDNFVLLALVTFLQKKYIYFKQSYTYFV